jgi:hypothetical protein
MASKLNFIFGKPPFEFLAGHLAQDDDFLSDARLIVNLDQDAYNCLATKLKETDDFLDRASLTSLTSEVLGEGDEASKVASIIYRIGGMLHDAGIPAKKAMEELGEAIESKATGLEKQDRRTLIDRLKALAAEPIGLAKQYKAAKLVDAIGAELDDFQIVCDIRPIFDHNRGRIEGAMPVAIMRLEYTPPDGSDDVVELRVTEKQLADFESKIKTAQQKLKVIKALLEKQQLPIPRTKSTVAGDQ